MNHKGEVPDYYFAFILSIIDWFLGVQTEAFGKGKATRNQGEDDQRSSQDEYGQCQAG